MGQTLTKKTGTKVSYIRKREGRTGVVAVPKVEPVTLEDVKRVIKMIIDDVFGGGKDNEDN